MNNVDYTKLRSYDIGTRPIGSGYQRNADQVQLGYTEQQAAPITNDFVPQAKMEALQTGAQTLLPFAKNTYSAVSAYLSAAKEATSQMKTASDFSSIASNMSNGATASMEAFPGVTTELVKDESLDAASQTASQAGKTAAQKALGGVNVAMNAYNALAGGYKTYLNWNDSDTLGGADLLAGSAKGTRYANGVSYSTMNGFDNKGFKDYVSAQNDAQKLGGVMSGVQAGMGAGGLIGMVGGPLGSLIGSGIGGVIGGIVGGIGGHHARDRRRRLYAEAVRNYANAAEAYNTQNASVAASQGIRNEYYATHADEGLPISKGEPNALVGARESLVGTDGNGNVTSVITMPEDQNHPYRLDNIPVKLDKGTGVAGNKIDPSTGLTIAEKVAPLAQLFNSTKNKHYKNHIGKLIKQEMELQDKLPDNNPNPYEEGLYLANEGKSIKDKMKTGKITLPKLDLKGYGWSIAPTVLNFLNARNMRREAERMPIEAYESYSPNPYIQQAGALMPKSVDVQPALNGINAQMRHQLYYNNQSPMSSGARMAMNANLANNVMKNRTWTQLSKIEQENKLRQMYADFLAKSGEIEQKMKMTSRDKFLDNLQKANAAKLARIDTARRSEMDALNKGFENAFNTWMFNKNTALYQQELNNENLKTLGNIEANAGNNYNKYSILPTIDKKFLNLSLNPFKQS